MHPADTAEKNRNGEHEMQSLSNAIQWTHKAIASMGDPEAKSQLAAALNTMTTVQAKAHKPYVGPERREK